LSTSSKSSAEYERPLPCFFLLLSLALLGFFLAASLSFALIPFEEDADGVIGITPTFPRDGDACCAPSPSATSFPLGVLCLLERSEFEEVTSAPPLGELVADEAAGEAEGEGVTSEMSFKFW